MKLTNYVRSAVAAAVMVGVGAIAIPVASAKGVAFQPNSTITIAEGAGANPNYIFPYVNCNYFSVSNLNQFQELLYRPLYWFGLGASTAVVPSLSTANMPVASNNNQTYTISLKGWKFSDGTTVNAQSVAFFVNMYKADVQKTGGAGYCGYNPGFGIPDQLASNNGFVVDNANDSVTFNFSSPVNPNWILYNYFSEITPMPLAWDSTGCATDAYGSAAAKTDCMADYNTLNAAATDTTQWTNSNENNSEVPWNISDGPWKLSAADALGNVTFVPNNSYSGPQKALVGQVKLKAYTSTTAELADLESNNLTSGYVDPTTPGLGAAPAPGKVGTNLSSLSANYNLTTGTSWSFNYLALMFSGNSGATSDNGVSVATQNAEMSKLYIRQALQEGIDQTGIISSVFHGYGLPTCSPLPTGASSAISGKVGCAYKYNLKAAASLLKAHGWTKQSGNLVCTNASLCGSGINVGDALSFRFSYLSSGTAPSTYDAMQSVINNWQSLGIQVVSDPQGFNTAVSTCTNEDICSWGAGWIYAPDYYPSGESLFANGGSFNVGNYLDTQMDTLITGTTSGNDTLTNYETYAAQQLPVLYVPNPTGSGEISKSLKSTIGFQANPLGNLMPEYLYF
jgi:peptide/nickel transport system substrate-binding protein